MAHALPRPRLGPGQGARHALQHRRRHPHGAGDRRDALRQLVGMPRRRLGSQRAGVRRPARSATASRSTAIRSASWSTRAASASSTRAPTSATTPTPSTAARSWSSPGQFAWQVFDRKVTHLLRDEYRIKRVTKVSADTLEELAGKLEDVDAAAFLDEVEAYNAAVDASAVQSRISRTAAHRGLAVARPTGPTRSTRRPSRPTRSPAASPSPSAACASTARRG